MDDADITSSPRHTMHYTARDAPFGVLTMTIFDIKDVDFTNYTLLIDNGVSGALVYTFYLKKDNANLNEDPPKVNFTKDSTNSTFNGGDCVSFICSSQGNPDTALTLTRKRTGEVLTNVKAVTLSHTLDSLDCLDTGVYVCSGQNSHGTDSGEININVRCAIKFSPAFESSPSVHAEIGATAKVDVEIYGFPEPSSMSIQKAIVSKAFTSSPRHTLRYTPREAPFGFVTVAIFGIEDMDFTNYRLTVDNGVGDALTYTFYLHEGMVTSKGGSMEVETEGGALKANAFILGIVATTMMTVIAFIVVVFFVRRNRIHRQGSDLYLVPIDTPDIVSSLQAQDTTRPEQYEDIDDEQSTTLSRHSSLSERVLPVPIPDAVTSDTPPFTDVAFVHVSLTSETTQYETLP